MSKKFYRDFIDGLVEISFSVAADRFRFGVWHPEPPPDQVKYNQLLAGLSDDQRETIAQLLVEERTSGIHDTLAYLEGESLTVSNEKGESFSESPFDTDLCYDYICRLNQDDWPK